VFGSKRALRVTSAADIYSIGQTILALLRNELVEPDQVELGTVEEPTLSTFDTLDDGMRLDMLQTYGLEIVGLVEQCVKTEPSERITAEDLLEQIWKCTREKTMPMEMPLFLRKLRRDEVLRYTPDQYADLAA